MSDLKQIGLSAKADQELKRLREEQRFASEMDGYRLAIALALRENLEPDWDGKDRRNKYAATAVDPTGELLEALHLFRPEMTDSPARALQALADVGVMYMAKEFDRGKNPVCP